MKDKKRIHEILGLLEKIWEKQPELRLCQIIGNSLATNPDEAIASDIYYIEDAYLEYFLGQYAEKNGISIV